MTDIKIPKVYHDFVDAWEDAVRRQATLDAYLSGQQSFVPNLLPELAVQLSGTDTLKVLRKLESEGKGAPSEEA